MTSEALQQETLRFGEFTLDVARGALYRGGEEIHLRPQSFAVLKYLAENAGRLVSKDELFAAVWGNTIVTEGSLTQCLIDVRRALGDESHELIRTVPRRGFVFEMAVGGAPAGGAPAAPGLRAPLRWLVAAVAFAAAALAVWLGTARLTGEAAPAKPRANTIAVLAFADLSEGGDHQYFADGVAEEILNLLARVPELRVVARTSSFSFRGSDADVAQIGEALDVVYLLEGSVRRAGDRVRVTAQLVDASSGAHVWSENYDRRLGDLLAVQTSIAERVARSLKITLAEGALSPGRRAVHPDAHDHFLQAQFLHNRRAPGDSALAERHYRKALDIDPEYAAAWAGLAGTQIVRIVEGEVDPDAGLEAMRVSVTRALALDPTLPEAHTRAAQYYANVGEWERAAQHHDRALALGPNSALSLAAAAGRSLRQGRYQEALSLQERAVELDPLGSVERSNYAYDLMFVGRYEEALREARRTRELSPARSEMAAQEALLLALLGRHREALVAARALPDEALRLQVRAIAYRGLGSEADARAAFDELAASAHPQRSLRLAEVHAQWGDADAAFALLPAIRAELDDAARTPGMRGLIDPIIISALLLPLHGDPRWQALLAEARRQNPYLQDP
jgi:TolB-like protein/DNA-binding winged helix-turn-helix (wHTH) protein/Tfp pilus assembly protein PilF